MNDEVETSDPADNLDQPQTLEASEDETLTEHVLPQFPIRLLFVCTLIAAVVFAIARHAYKTDASWAIGFTLMSVTCIACFCLYALLFLLSNILRLNR